MSFYDVQHTTNKCVICWFVAHFLSYDHLNWFTVGQVIAKIKRVNSFSETQSTFTEQAFTVAGLLAVDFLAGLSA